MEFIKNISEKDYQQLYLNTPSAHFLQSIEWGKIVSKTRNQEAILVGLKDQNKYVAGALLLKKKTPLHMCYYYAPRGFVIDYNNPTLLSEFTKGLNQMMKEENAIYLKVDPEVKYQTIDEEANKIDGEDNYQLFNQFINLKYRHQGFNKLHEKNQPRYTFRRYFENYHNIDEIDESISKTFMKALKRSYNYNLKVSLADNIDDFIRLNKFNAIKDGFNGYNELFYQTFFNETKNSNNVKIFNISLNPEELVEKFTKELNDIEESIKNNTINKKDRGNAKETINRLNKDIATFKDIKDKEIVIVSMVCVYANKNAWTLYIGNDQLGEYTFAVNRVYYEAIIDAYNNQYDFIDLFGTVGDIHTKYKNLAGLHEYKRKFGDEYIEFIGEFDLINKKFWYYVLPPFLKIYRSLLKLKRK